MSHDPSIPFSDSDALGEVLQKVFSDQDELDRTSKFHPGERVRVVADLYQLIEVLKTNTGSEVDAYLVARELLQTDGTIFSASRLTDKSDDDWKTYYTVEYSMYGVNQYYVLPEEFLELR